jgi:prevent-host-death family protein
MRSVGLKVLKNKLSEYVRLAADGETVLVTDRGRVVAELAPPRPQHNAVSEDEFLAQAAREGWLKPAGKRRGGPPPQAPGPRMTLDEILKDLDEARADRDLS